VTINCKSDCDIKEGCRRFLFVTDSHVSCEDKSALP